MGTQLPVPAGHTNPDLKTDAARRDHEEVSQSCVSTQPLVSDAPPPKTTVVRPTSLRIASLLPVTYVVKKVIVTPARLRHYATSLKVTGSNPDEVDFFSRLSNPSSRTMVLASTQPLTEISTRNLPGL
jgi:hypothetical protein